MKKSIFILPLFIPTFFLACNNDNEKADLDKKDLLSTDMVVNPNSAAGVDTTAMNAMPVLVFKDTIYDFGNMREGEVGSYDFEFNNAGNSPLIITSASGSCGCTVPEYPREPIQPGKGGIMKVKFNTADKTGHQEKSVSVVTNSTRGTHTLYIKADVQANK